MVDSAQAKPPGLSFSLVEPEHHQTDLGWGKKRFIPKHKRCHVVAGGVKRNLSRGTVAGWTPGEGALPLQLAAESRSSMQDRSWKHAYLTPVKLKPIPGEFCCFVPSSREWAQMKLKQVLIKTRTILQTGFLITVNICQGKLQRGRKIVISCATCHFHLITITLFCRAKTSVLHNKLLSWGLVWIESCEALPWVPKLAA